MRNYDFFNFATLFLETINGYVKCNKNKKDMYLKN